MSDHNPIIFYTGETHEVKYRKFMFEKSWLQHPNFQARVKTAWESYVDASEGSSKTEKS
jgi:hypothetical protein